MPTVASSPSILIHSCDLVYCRSAGVLDAIARASYAFFFDWLRTRPLRRRYTVAGWVGHPDTLFLVAGFVERCLDNPRTHRLLAHDHVELAALARQIGRHIAQAQVLAQCGRGHAGGHVADPLAGKAANLVAAAGNAAPDHL